MKKVKQAVFQLYSVNIWIGVLVGCAGLLMTTPGVAQVAISVGVQELYDDNIYLEDDQMVLPVETVDPVTGERMLVAPSKDRDGDVNDDIISSPYLTLSAAVPLSEHLATSVEGRVGAFFFADESDEDRLALDTTIMTSAEESLIPKPFYMDLSSHISSRSQDIAVVDGSIARQSETHTLTFQTGLRSWELAPKTDLGLGYIFERHDFLGEFLFKDRDNRLDEEGADYFRNGMETSVTRHITAELDMDVHAGVDYLKFTQVESNDLVERDESELDRLEYKAGTGATYTVSEKLQLKGEAGVDVSDFTKNQEPRCITVINADGTQSTFTEESDGSDVSFMFRGSVMYSPDSDTGIKGEALQTRAVNIDGDRLLVRSFSLDLSRKLGERAELMGRGNYTQFDEGDSLGKSTDRLELSTAFRMSLTESISLSVGYAFAKQMADENSNMTGLLSDDYESHRAFITLDAGLVGVTS